MWPSASTSLDPDRRMGDFGGAGLRARLAASAAINALSEKRERPYFAALRQGGHGGPPHRDHCSQSRSACLAAHAALRHARFAVSCEQIVQPSVGRPGGGEKRATQGRSRMSLSNVEIADAPADLAPEAGGISRFRDQAAITVMVGSNIFNVLALIVVSPLVAAISAYFAEHAHNGVVLSLPFYDVQPQVAAQLMITLLNIGIMFAGPLLGLLAERVGYTRLLTIALAIYAVAGSAGLYLQSPAGLLLSRLLLGLVAASISISCYSLIGLRFK